MPTYAATSTIFASQAIQDTVQQVFAVSQELPTFFGMGMVRVTEGGEPKTERGPNLEPTIHGREGAWDTFESVRSPAPIVAYDSPSVELTRSPIGNRRFLTPRTAVHVRLDINELNRYRRHGGQLDQFDEAGEKRIAMEQARLGETLAAWRTMLILGMMRGKLWARYRGDKGDQIYLSDPTDDGLPAEVIDYDMPTGSRSNFVGAYGDRGSLQPLDPLGLGESIINVPWTTDTARIDQHLTTINSRFHALYGGNLEVVILNSTTWTHVLANQSIRNLAGSVNRPWESWSRDNSEDVNGKKITSFKGVLAGLPWVEFRINDEMIQQVPGGPLVNQIPNGYIWCGPNPTGGRGQTFKGIEGREWVQEGPNVVEAEKIGIYAWSERLHDPARIKIHVGDNFLPAVVVPKCHMWVRVY